MYTPANRDLDALGQYVPFLPGGCAEAAPWSGADLARGQYLCEVCQDAMTDEVLPATESATGLEIAICHACRARQGR